LNLKFWAFLRERADRRIAPKTELFSCRFCARFWEIGGQITAAKKLLVKRLASNRASRNPQPPVVPAVEKHKIVTSVFVVWRQFGSHTSAQQPTNGCYAGFSYSVNCDVNAILY
jgi:hypothetical protein